MLADKFPWDQREDLVGTPLRTLVEVSLFEINRLETVEVVLTIWDKGERARRIGVVQSDVALKRSDIECSLRRTCVLL
jgi:hypothetical protein